MPPAPALARVKVSGPLDGTRSLVSEHALDIPGYAPDWHDDAETLIAKARLMALRGRAVQEAWTLWTGYGWVDRAPVILCMDGAQVEVCARGVTELSVTRDSVRLDQAVDAGAAEIGAAEDAPCWKRNENHELAAIVNREVTDVGAVEYCLDPVASRKFGKEWVLSGIYLRFDQVHLEVFNGLDCNRLSNMPDRDHPVRYISCSQWPALVADSGG